MRDPASRPRLERQHVVGQEGKSSRDKRGAERRLAVSAIAQEGDGLAIDDHCRGVQRLIAERQQREGQRLPEQIGCQRGVGGFTQAVVLDGPSVGRNQTLEQPCPAQIRRAVRKSPAVEPVSGRTRNLLQFAGARKARGPAGLEAARQDAPERQPAETKAEENLRG